ncbi:hypothetical protein [Actinopolymorpha pittospori]|uniref:Uncharacterized protein n=1 Tax=Actinopolymorpha pittospori TaxID=648752 RepID=A0A927RHN0_9ACTN|nr:hypothetical protein [Actinopolymorpha pittospori]MBE1603648.1 hypothetical protein [Actinopolymorpha pittospori]
MTISLGLACLRRGLDELAPSRLDLPHVVWHNPGGPQELRVLHEVDVVRQPDERI